MHKSDKPDKRTNSQKPCKETHKAESDYKEQLKARINMDIKPNSKIDKKAYEVGGSHKLGKAGEMNGANSKHIC